MKCENCQNNHNGNYGSGRFCSSQCARGFSTKSKRKEINLKVSNKLTRVKVDKICPICNKKFLARNIYKIHCSRTCATIFKNKNRIVSTFSKQKISNSIKLAYKNGLNTNGGNTKWYEIQTSNGLIKVQGSYELRTAKILENWKQNNLIFDWEYTNDRFKYQNLDNKESTYLLDFKIFITNNEFYYLEIKGFERPNDKLKWEAVKILGFRLDIWFDKEIKENELIINGDCSR